MTTERPTLKFSQFDPEPCAFPKPRLSPLPDRPEWSTSPSRYAHCAVPSAPRHFRHFTRGRYALGEAYRLAGLGPQGTLLAPAYHCVTMLDPALALGADVQLYPLQSDLSPDLARLDRVLAACEKPASTLLATHFFGFPQDFAALKQWCDAHRIVLIEDCSHVLFTEHFQAPGTGIFGRLVAASPYKFFACDDGGLLYSPAHRELDTVATNPAGLIDELRGVKRVVEKFRSTDSSAADTDLIERQLLALARNPLVTARERIVERSLPSSQYCLAATKTSSLRSSRTLIERASIADNIARRRHNYRRWALALLNADNCHALYRDLPEDCVPYMFPLYIEHPLPLFYWLKHLGLPIWRWDEMAVSNCPIAQDYRLHLIHLPCHQSLTQSQLNWMIAALQKSLPRAAPGVR